MSCITGRQLQDLQLQQWSARPLPVRRMKKLLQLTMVLASPIGYSCVASKGTPQAGQAPADLPYGCPTSYGGLIRGTKTWTLAGGVAISCKHACCRLFGVGWRKHSFRGDGALAGDRHVSVSVSQMQSWRTEKANPAQLVGWDKAAGAQARGMHACTHARLGAQ